MPDLNFSKNKMKSHITKNKKIQSPISILPCFHSTGNMDKDEIFYPVRDRDVQEVGECRFFKGFGLGLGWFMYLIVGFSPRKLSHFNPRESIFAGHLLGCVSSLACLAGWSWLVYRYWLLAGTHALLVHYVAPVCVFASWLVVVTFLHHMDKGAVFSFFNPFNATGVNVTTYLY